MNMFLDEITKNEHIDSDANYKITIIDNNEKEHTFDEWKVLDDKPEAIFVKYVDDQLGEENAILLYAGTKKGWSIPDKVRWANAPTHLQEYNQSYFGDMYNGYKNCQDMINIVSEKKIAEYNSGEEWSNMWKKPNPLFGNDIKDLPDKMEKWQDYLPALASIHDLRTVINGYIAVAYVPAIGQLEKISKHIDDINMALVTAGGEPVQLKADNEVRVYWSSNEANQMDSEKYFIFEKPFTGIAYTGKNAKRSILPLFKIMK